MMEAWVIGAMVLPRWQGIEDAMSAA